MSVTHKIKVLRKLNVWEIEKLTHGNLVVNFSIYEVIMEGMKYYFLPNVTQVRDFLDETYIGNPIEYTITTKYSLTPTKDMSSNEVMFFADKNPTLMVKGCEWNTAKIELVNKEFPDEYVIERVDQHVLKKHGKIVFRGTIQEVENHKTFLEVYEIIKNNPSDLAAGKICRMFGYNV